MSGLTGQTVSVCGNVFRFVEMIGRGSYGTVHKAINLSSGAAVAIKLIDKDKVRRPHERQSIEKEIETMRVAVEQFENGHPHIIRLLCTKESHDHIYIVMEYCAGGDIAMLMKMQNGLSVDQTRLYMSQLASGLTFLRSTNVVHRDLKPANLLLSSKNPSTAKLKIADFGFARELKQESMAESVVGSPLYMAPELLEYKSYDAKADLWSVGVILYEMLVNDHPFLVVDKSHATNHLALRRNIYRYFEKFGKVRFPPSLNAPKECQDLVEGLLRVDPRKRISFEEFFNAPFLLPPTPSEPEQPLQRSRETQALVAEDPMECEEWLAASDEEYVIVDKEYEEIGRQVLDDQDDATDAQVTDVVVDTTTPPSTPKEDNKWTDEQQVEELLGICYKSFDVGSVALFVPTPLGHFIAFHEGCPHYYLSEETIAAFKKEDGSNPPYVLGSIVFIEDCVAAAENPYALKDGTTYHVVMVAPLLSSSSHHSEQAGTGGSLGFDETPAELPLSQSLTAKSPTNAEAVQVKTAATATGGKMEHQRISFRNFQISHLALFFLKGGKLPYMAFNEGAPNYYLANESIQAAVQGSEDKTAPAYILGEVIIIDTFQATEDFNPYRLAYGTRFYVVTVANPKRR